MAISPVCLVNNVPTTNGVDVPGGSQVTISLAQRAGVDVWELECIGADDQFAVEKVNDVLSQAMTSAAVLAKSITFTAPPAPFSWVIRSTVQRGKDRNGIPHPEYVTSFKVSVRTPQNLRLMALNETFENNAAAGWVSIINALVRSGGFGTSFRASADLRGDAQAQYVAQLSGPLGGAPLAVLPALAGGGDGLRFATQFIDTGSGNGTYELDPTKPMALFMNASLPQYIGSPKVFLSGREGTFYFIENASPTDIDAIRLKATGALAIGRSSPQLPGFSGVVVVLGTIGGNLTPFIVASSAVPAPLPPPPPVPAAAHGVIATATAGFDNDFGNIEYQLKQSGRPNQPQPWVAVPGLALPLPGCKVGDLITVQGTVTLQMGPRSQFGHFGLWLRQGQTTPLLVKQTWVHTNVAEPWTFPVSAAIRVRADDDYALSGHLSTDTRDTLYLQSPTSLTGMLLRV